jgi:hypothetical protein
LIENFQEDLVNDKVQVRAETWELVACPKLIWYGLQVDLKSFPQGQPFSGSMDQKINEIDKGGSGRMFFQLI